MCRRDKVGRTHWLDLARAVQSTGPRANPGQQDSGEMCRMVDRRSKESRVAVNACRRRELVGQMSRISEYCKQPVKEEAATKKHLERPDAHGPVYRILWQNGADTRS